MCFLMIISVLMNIESLPGYISIGKTKRDGINGKMNGGIHTGMLPFVMRWFHYGEKRLVVLRLFHLLHHPCVKAGFKLTHHPCRHASDESGSFPFIR